MLFDYRAHLSLLGVSVILVSTETIVSIYSWGLFIKGD